MVTLDRLIDMAEDPRWAGGFTEGDVLRDLQWPLTLAAKLIDEAVAHRLLRVLRHDAVMPIYIRDWGTSR